MSELPFSVFKNVLPVLSNKLLDRAVKQKSKRYMKNQGYLV